MNRYNRQIILDEIGVEGQEKISSARILVIGAGGLGCPALQYLAGAGVGTLGVIDFDIVEESNLQRQVLFGTSSLGKNKALAAGERLQDLNPEININAIPAMLDADNAVALFMEYDIVIDASDNFQTRYMANDSSLKTGRPLIYGAIHKFEGQVSVFNYQKGPSYRCLFPAPPAPDDIPNCADAGVLGVLPGIIGTMQATEALKIILGLGKILSGKLWCYDALTTSVQLYKIQRKEAVIQETLARSIQVEPHTSICNTDIRKISLEDAMILPDLQLVDVREQGELPLIQNQEILSWPLSAIKTTTSPFEPSQNLVLFCQHGQRSGEAAVILAKQGFNCYSLSAGAAEIKEYLQILRHERT